MDPIRKRGNTLDLSQAKPKAPAGPAMPKRPYTPEVKAQAPRVAPVPTHSLEVAEAIDAARAEKAQAQAQAPAPAPTAPAPAPAASPNRSRFWPAFMKFLGLLIIFGLIVAGGLYIYIHFYTQQ
ncbi:MAG TPA: hypothetical protein VLF21_01815 [Candidatus Saccharimonadales bacterium]|nr:hypothetical protein [Candidatus Saccharimonadales bacterium]